MTTKAQVRRSKLGCWACKSRHVRCDGLRPSCSNCVNRDGKCTYGLRLIWQEDSLSRGVCHGRSKSGRYPASRQAAKSRPINYDTIAFLNTNTHDLESYYSLFCDLPGQSSTALRYCQDKRNEDRFMAPARTRHDSVVDGSLTLYRPSSLPIPATTTGFDFALLSYYETVVCSSSTLLDDKDSNPYRHLLLPMAMQIDSVYHAIMAVTAQILSISNPKWEVAALEHGIHATQALSRTIQRSKEDSATLREMQVLTLLLCWLEITNNSSASWLTHLYGMQSMLVATHETAGMPAHSDNFHRFLTRYFVFHWVLARTVFAVDNDAEIGQADIHQCDAERQQKESLGMHCSAWTEYLSLYLPAEEMNQIDPYMGMSNTLLLLINETAELYRETSWLTMSEQHGTIRERLQRIRRSLCNLHQTSPVHTGYDKEAFDAIAETNRLGAVLYLHAVGCLKLNRTESWSYEDDDGVHDMRSLLKTLITHISVNFDLVSKCAAMPLWPLFITGCLCTNDDDRVQVASLFDRLEAQNRFGNIAPARKVVQCVWKQHDLNVQDDRKRRKTMADLHGPGLEQSTGKTKGFGWESAMRILGNWKLSLT